MTLTTFLLGCFCFGLFASALSLVSGHAHLHFPGIHGHVHLHLHLGRAAKRGGDHGLNVGSIAVFLAWFGGTGYLLTRYSALWVVLSLGLAVTTGLAAAWVVGLFLARLLRLEALDEDGADYRLEGVLGQVTSQIRPGGVGEILFVQNGVRRSAPARCERGGAIDRGVEVVVTRFAKGICAVRRFDELVDLPPDPAAWTDLKTLNGGS